MTLMSAWYCFIETSHNVLSSRGTYSYCLKLMYVFVFENS